MDRDQRFEREALPHLRSLFATAYRMTRNAHDAEDLVQETCLRAYRAFDRYTPDTNIRAWLYTILHRARTDAFRKAGRSPETVELVDDPPGPAASPEVRAAQGQELSQALAQVPELFRTAVLMRDVEGFTYDEIARMLEVPVGTVMSRIHRGRAVLRKLLEAP